MSNVVAENHDIECGFLIVELNGGDEYYYLEWDIEEDVEGCRDTEEVLYGTRDYYVSSFEIGSFLDGNVEFSNDIERIELIGYNNCLIRNIGITKQELDEIIAEAKLK